MTSALLSDAVASVRFLPAAKLNGTPSTLTVHLIDSSGGAVASGTTDDLTTTGNATRYSSGTVTIGETVNAVNDAPVATITPATYSATEQVNFSLKNNGLSVSDVDGGPPGSETVTLSVTEGILTVTTGGSGATVGNSGTSAVTVSGTIAQINALLNTDVTSTVIYNDNTNHPGASATLTLAINDNGNTGGGSLTASDTATINVTAVNDTPDLTPNSPSAATFISESSSPAALLSTGAVRIPTTPPTTTAEA